MSLVLDNVRLSIGRLNFSFNLTANAGEVHAILGKSGTGKSTLLNVIGGFLTPTQGDISWQGESILALAPDVRPVTTLFQAHNLFDHLTVRQNVGLGMAANLKLSEQDWFAVDSALQEVGLEERASYRPEQLSGGEQQRAGLARCLLRQRPILLLDEPYGALDEATRSEMLTLTQRVISDRQLCVLMVTHNPQDAVHLQAIQNTVVNGVLHATEVSK